MARLLNIRTDLSDYKAPQYGYDRRGAGPRNTNASGQPYVVQSLPARTFSIADFGADTGPAISEDFLLRGGSLTPERIARDTSRLTKMFFDLKSPNGLLFTAKQEALSRSSVNIKAMAGTPSSTNDNKLTFNNGVYLPTSTLAQVVTNAAGGHLLKQGINPSFDTSEAAARGNAGGIFSFITGDSLPLSNPIYFETKAFAERVSNTSQSRLFTLLNSNINTDTAGVNDLYSYSGGPGSVLGIGKTTISSLVDQRTGLNNPELRNSGFFLSGKTLDTNFGFNYSIFGKKQTGPTPWSFQGGTYFGNLNNTGSIGKSVTGRYVNLTGTTLNNLIGDTGLLKINNDVNNSSQINNVGLSVFQNGFQSNSPSVTGLGTTLDYEKLMDSKGSGVVATGNENNDYPEAQIIQDFRTKTKSDSVSAPAYNDETKRYGGRVNLGNAGAKNSSTSYTSGRGIPLDKINALEIYKSENADPSKPINDLCKFRIGVIDNDNPSLKTYIHFRAFLDSMDDNYTAEWSNQKYAGRAESLYNYQGFDRSFNLSWTVVAQSKEELMPMYQKLNYLASVCAPDYSADGYMRGNLIELTVGGYLFNQVGIMTGINYTIPMESPWEIAINNIGEPDRTVKELPFMIKVSGFQFIPIHNFVPNVQKNIFKETNSEGPGTLGDLATFGPEKYISLSNGFKTVADNKDGYYSRETLLQEQAELENQRIEEEASEAERQFELEELENFTNQNELA